MECSSRGCWCAIEFPFKRLLDSLVDLPFALPTAVAGIALTTIYAPNGLLGRPLAELGIHVAFTRLGIVVALTFIGLPFVVRTVQPVLEDLDRELEEAAASLGAGRWQTFRRVLYPAIAPAAITGFALAFARGVGEYGSVIFIAGNMPMRTEIAPLLIVTKLEEYDYSGRHRDRDGDAGHLVRAAARHQRVAAVERRTAAGRRSGGAGSAPGAGAKWLTRSRQASRRRSPSRRWSSVCSSASPCSFSAIFLLVPLGCVFADAFGHGIRAYLATFRDPDTLSSIRLTLLAALDRGSAATSSSESRPRGRSASSSFSARAC